MVAVFAVQGRAMGKFAAAIVVAGLLACETRVLDVSGADDGDGEPCDGGVRCAAGMVCATVADSRACAPAIEVHGRVIDAATKVGISGARVHESGYVAVSDEDGGFVLSIAAPRTADGAPASGARVTLQAFAAGYRPVPAGLQVALPIAVDAAMFDEDRKAYVVGEEANTTVGMFALARDGANISGRVGGEAPGGTLVVAEARGVYGLAGMDGTYVLFDVPAGEVTVRGYRMGVALKEREVEVAGEDLVDVDLAVDAKGAPGAVTGSVQFVDAGGGAATSVVLVPSSVFDEALARGPTPPGLRAGGVTGAFTVAGVPAGKYRVLAGFENDDLVRDPDGKIGGTVVPEVDVKDKEADAGSFKVTGALAVVGPGRDEPEVVTGTPTFTFASDPGAEHYVVQVYDELGVMVWATEAPKTAGNADVAVVYAGPGLAPGAFYQFRAVSIKDDDDAALSTTEDLRGVFIAG
jgi:hypothetical protein